MSHLLLINGFSLETNKEDVKDYLANTLHEENVQNVWLDPLSSTRAVAMVEKAVDLEKIQSTSLVYETVPSTESAFVLSHGSLKFGAIDKIFLLFSSKRHGGGKVTKVRYIGQENCFEVVFHKGWDAVLAVCERTWEIENIVFTVCPYFSCFKEPVHSQFRRLLWQMQKLESDKKVKKITEGPRVFNTVTQTQLVQKSNPGTDSQSTSDQAPEEKTQDSSSVKRNTDFTNINKEQIELKKSTFFFHDSLLPYFLNLLNFQTALLKHNSNLRIEFDDDELEADIVGPPALVKLIHKILSREDGKTPFSKQEKQFISSENIQKDVEALVTELYWHIEIDSLEQPILVVNKEGQKLRFQEFLKSLIIARSCAPLLSDNFKTSEEWLSFLDGFNRSYSYRQIIVSSNTVCLLSLAYKHHDLDFMLNLIEGKIIHATRKGNTDNSETRKPEYSQDNVLNRQKKNTQASSTSLETSSKFLHELNERLTDGSPESIKKSDSDMTSRQEDVKMSEQNKLVDQSLTSRAVDETKITIICNHKFYVWLFHLLNLETAVKNKGINAAVEIDELQNVIMATGKKDETKRLKDIITLETEQIALTDNEEKLLADENFRKEIEKFVQHSRWRLVLDVSLSLTMYIKDSGGEKLPLKDFLSLLLSLGHDEGTTSETLGQSLEWVSHKETCASVQPYPVDSRGSISFISISPEVHDKSFSIINSDFRGSTLEDSNLMMSIDTDQHRSVMKNSWPRQDQSEKKTLDKELDQNGQASRGLNGQAPRGPNVQESRGLNSETTRSLSEVKKSLQKFTIICSHHFYVWLLQVLDLKSAVMKKYKDLTVEMKIEDVEVVIRGQGHDADKLKTLVLSQQEMISLTDDEEDFLAEFDVLQHLEAVVRRAGYYIDVASEWSDSVVIKDIDDQQISIPEIISLLLIRKRCQPLPSGSYQNNPEWQSFVESVYTTHSLCRVIVDNKDVILLTVSEGVDCMNIVKSINEFVSRLSGTRQTSGSLRNQHMMKSRADNDLRDARHPESPQKETSKQPLSVRQIAMKFEGKTEVEQDFKKFFTKQAMEVTQIAQEAKLLSDENLQVKPPSEEINKNIWDKSKVKISPMKSKVLKSSFPRTPEIYTFTVHQSSFSEMTSSSERRSYRLLNDKSENGMLFYRSKSSHEPLSAHVYSLKPEESAYCSTFLRHDLDTLTHGYTDCSAQLIYNTDSIEVKATSKIAVDSICEKLESLVKTIQFETHQVCFPGLENFLETSDGVEFIESISATCKCYIDFPFEAPLSQNKHSITPDYRIVSLGSAICNGFNLHLLYGNIKNTNPQVKVELSPSKASECSVKTQGTSSHLVLHFPEHLSNQESETEDSFKKSLTLVLQQAKYINCASLMFSTVLLHEADSALSFSHLAEMVLGQLLETYHSKNPSFGVNNPDVYICEPGNVELLEEFKSVLEKHAFKFGPPDQRSWERISFPDVSQVTDYRGLKVKVKVEPQSHQICDFRTLICYPVLPNLDISSCPIMQDEFCSIPDLEDEVRKFLMNYPEGLSVGDSLHINCLEGNREALLYVCPEWGFDSLMAIHDALETCLLASSEFEAVHIVPPGLHVHPKYPKKFLSHRVFHDLDQLLFDKLTFRQQHIVLIIEDKLYRKAFDKELWKRYSNTDEKKAANVTPIKNKVVRQSSTEDTSTISNTTTVSLVTFGAASVENMRKASALLTDGLSHRMSSTSVKLSLNKEATLLCESLIKQEQCWLVSILLQKQMLDNTSAEESTKKQKKKGKKKNKGLDQNKSLVGCTLTVEGLSQTVVDDFKNMLTYKAITFN